MEIEEVNLENPLKTAGKSAPARRSFDFKEFLTNRGLVIGIAIFFIVGLGILSGWLLSGGGKGLGASLQTEVGEGQKPKKGEEFGVQDKETFSDYAIGEIAEGGVNGEGTHHLLREGGPSQTVYLFSSVLNLDDFVGRKVEVWGETFSAEKAGWLMDVGKLKVLE
jgi:hypothetical protein